MAVQIERQHLIEMIANVTTTALWYILLRPGWLGVLGMIAGLCWFTFIYPPFGASLFTFTAPVGLLVVVIMIFWLLVFGVDERKWRDQAGVASGS